jgi:hypothetical protein
MTRSLVLPALLLICACDREEDLAPIGEAPPIEGERWVTGLGIDIRVPEGVDGAAIAVQVDAVTEDWIAYWSAREIGWQRSVLLHRARMVPVVFYATDTVANRSGFYKYQSHAGIALYGGFYDAYFGRQLSGVWIWFHEATHGLKGDFHP